MNRVVCETELMRSGLSGFFNNIFQNSMRTDRNVFHVAMSTSVDAPYMNLSTGKPYIKDTCFCLEALGVL